MSDENHDNACVPFFSKRAKLSPKKPPEELKAAEELVNKIEVEKNPQMDDKMDAESSGNNPASEGETAAEELVNKIEVEKNPQMDDKMDAESSGNNPASEGETGQKKKVPIQAVASSSTDASSLLESSVPPPLSPATYAALIEAKNSMIFDVDPFEQSDLTEELPAVEGERIFHVAVFYYSEVAEFRCFENETFFKVFHDVAERFQLKPTEFLIYLNNRCVAITDTPKTLGMPEHDTFECIPYKPNDVPSSSALDDDTLTVTFQSNDSKSKIDIIVNKMEKMKVIMEQYAKKRKMPLNEFTFEFDGTKLVGTETPAELDMETGDCIDVMVFMPLPECSHASDDRFFVNQPWDDSPSGAQSCSKEDYFSVYFEDFTFADSDSNGSDIVALD